MEGLTNNQRLVSRHPGMGQHPTLPGDNDQAELSLHRQEDLRRLLTEAHQTEDDGAEGNTGKRYRYAENKLSGPSGILLATRARSASATCCWANLPNVD